MFELAHVKVKPQDYVCQECGKQLLRTPSGFYACIIPEHTKLLTQVRCANIFQQVFDRTIKIEAGKWWAAEKANYAGPTYSENGWPIAIRTSIRGIYRMDGSNWLYRVTSSVSQRQYPAVRLSPVRQLPRDVYLRRLTFREFMRMYKRGAFKVKELAAT